MDGVGVDVDTPVESWAGTATRRAESSASWSIEAITRSVTAAEAKEFSSGTAPSASVPSMARTKWSSSALYSSPRT